MHSVKAQKTCPTQCNTTENARERDFPLIVSYYCGRKIISLYQAQVARLQNHTITQI